MNSPITMAVVTNPPDLDPEIAPAQGPATGSGPPREPARPRGIAAVDPDGQDHRNGHHDQDVEVELLAAGARGHGPGRDMRPARNHRTRSAAMDKTAQITNIITNGMSLERPLRW